MSEKKQRGSNSSRMRSPSRPQDRRQDASGKGEKTMINDKKIG